MPQRFVRHGRAWHLEIDDAESLRSVLELDDALWIATSAPLGTLHADAGLLAGIDLDGDGRITVRDVKAAIRWCFDQLGDVSRIGDELRPLARAAIKEPGL